MPASRGRGGRAGEMDSGEELARLLALQLRFLLGSQAQAIAELNRVGFGSSRIAELLGTTANTVNVALNRAKRESQARNRS